MKGIVIVILVFVVAAAVALGSLFKSGRRKSGSEEERWPLYARRPLSSPEQILYYRLRQALPEHIVLAQVQLSRFLGVEKGNNYQSWINRINRQSADFLICAKDASVVAVIELDDATHERADRKEADAKKNKALDSAGIRIVRWNTKTMPNADQIRAEFGV